MPQTVLYNYAVIIYLWMRLAYQYVSYVTPERLVFKYYAHRIPIKTATSPLNKDFLYNM